MIIIFLIWLFLILWTTYTVTGEKTNTKKLRTPLVITSIIIQIILIASAGYLLEPLREKFGYNSILSHTLDGVIAFLSPIIITLIVFVVLRSLIK